MRGQGEHRPPQDGMSMRSATRWPRTQVAVTGPVVARGGGSSQRTALELEGQTESVLTCCG